MITGHCHCGRVAFEIEGEIPKALTRCTCSICSRRGYLLAYYTPEQFRVTTPGQGKAYRWNTKQVALVFCEACGCSVYNDSPAFERDGSWDGETRRIGVNARLFDGYDAAEAPVTVLDGAHLW